jgi:hypothetical protein
VLNRVARVVHRADFNKSVIPAGEYLAILTKPSVVKSSLFSAYKKVGINLSVSKKQKLGTEQYSKPIDETVSLLHFLLP